MANARLGWFSPLGVAASIRASARRVGLRAHCFRFSACTASEWPLGGLVFGLISSAFRPAPLRSGHWASSFFRLPFRRLPLGGLTFGLTASAFRHAPLRGCPRRVDSSAGRVGLRAHCFRFSACTASELPSAGWPSGSRLPLFGTRRFGVAARRVGSSAFRFGVVLGGLAFGLTASAFRHAPIRSGCWASSFFRLPFRRLPFGGLVFGLTASAFRHAPLRKLPSAG